MLAALGPMPPAEQPSERAISPISPALLDLPHISPTSLPHIFPGERAIWVAALICPCGTDRASWPVLDIRAEVLTATTPMERLAAAKMGLVDSIYKLKGGNWPMSTYFWQ